jgi:hypothetical protein
MRGTFALEAPAVTVSTVTGWQINKIDSILGQGEHMQSQNTLKCKTVLKVSVS